MSLFSFLKSKIHSRAFFLGVASLFLIVMMVGVWQFKAEIIAFLTPATASADCDRKCEAKKIAKRMVERYLLDRIDIKGSTVSGIINQPFGGQILGSLECPGNASVAFVINPVAGPAGPYVVSRIGPALKNYRSVLIGRQVLGTAHPVGVCVLLVLGIPIPIPVPFSVTVDPGMGTSGGSDRGPGKLGPAVDGPAIPPGDNATTTPPVIGPCSQYAANGVAYQSDGTGYYPSNDRMEGGFLDRRGNRLYTLQQFLSGQAPYVSVAMDLPAGQTVSGIQTKGIFNYGQKLCIPEMEARFGKPIEFRVVDTGGAFFGKGTSRIDICTQNAAASHDPTVNGNLTLIPMDAVTAPDTGICDANLNGWDFNPGIRAQVGDASSPLKSLLACMCNNLNQQGIKGKITSISDSAAVGNLAACRGNNRLAACAHSATSCHYGGNNGGNKSYAADIGIQVGAAAVMNAARACGAGDVRDESNLNHIHVAVSQCRNGGAD